MNDQAIRKIVVVGGGTAGWMTAAALARVLKGRAHRPSERPFASSHEILVVESPEIGTIGVGEATLPPIRFYNQTLGLDGVDFIKKTQATFKLGIEFRDWGRLGHRFFHGFGDFGPPIENRSSFLYWLRLARAGGEMPSYEEWSTATVMARQNRFVPPSGDQPGAANAYGYAFHFDAGLYAAYLRDYATQRGAARIEGTIVDVELRPEDGFVAAVKLRDGRRIDGDLFVDCSGFRALLIEGVMRSAYEDWSAWLPCNSARAVPCARIEPLTPYTTSTARAAGWQWRIPLQHRTGNGHVYCDAFTTDEEATRVLLEGLDGPPLDAPRQLRFTTGLRRESWVKNVVAVGLSSGFLEPLESTSIQLIMDAVARLIELFPDRDCQRGLAAEFNRRSARQYESIRDFIILHYKLTQRTDSEFWRYCASMPIPDTLAHQIEVYRESGRVVILDKDSFAEPSWISIMHGQGLEPRANDPFAGLVDEQALRTHFTRLRQAIAGTVAGMPDHAAFIERYAKAEPLPFAA
ncbi:MAG: tryptophan halogenase family protein [Pseudomonadota bacterium]